MSDKIVENVVEQAMALKKIAIENAKTELLNELSPKITKLFDEKIESSSKKVMKEQEEEIDAAATDEGTAEAEVDLDDLAKEIEAEDGTGEGEEKSVEEKVEDLEQKVDAVEDKVEVVKDDVAELKGGDAEKKEEAPAEDEELEIEDDSKEDEALDLGEAVDIAIKDNDVHINVEPEAANDQFVDIIDDTASGTDDEDEYVDVEDDSDVEDSMEESRKMKLEHRIAVLKSALNRASKIIVSERVAMRKVKEILEETKLLNEKLVLVNRIFAKYDLDKNRKYKVLEAFDKATNSRDSVVVYKTILEQLDKKATPLKETKKEVPAKVAKLEEGIKKDTDAKALLKEVARPTGALPSNKILSVDRIKKLAGITEE
jgi:hypothetical protein